MSEQQAQHVVNLVFDESDLDYEMRQLANKDYVVWINGVFLWSEDDWYRLKDALISEARRVACKSQENMIWQELK